MPRKARKISKSGIYHIIMRGINKQTVFNDNEDYDRFLDVLQRFKNKSGYQIFAYCLMGNHLHLLLKEGTEPLGIAMKRICGSYVYWYNLKYQRIGNLFQDRFKSEPIDDDAYFLIVLRYIHQNPIKAGIENNIADYKWSSFNEYLKKGRLIDSAYVLSLFGFETKKATESFSKYIYEDSKFIGFEADHRRKINDNEAKNIICDICRFDNPYKIQELENMERDRILKAIIQKGISMRQIGRLCGISQCIILKVR